MRILSNIKLTFTCALAIVCVVASYALLPLSVDILTGNNILTLFVGFAIVPLGIGLYISGVFGTLSLIISGIFNKTKIWWILGILLAIANIGVLIVSFI